MTQDILDEISDKIHEAVCEREFDEVIKHAQKAKQIQERSRRPAQALAKDMISEHTGNIGQYRRAIDILLYKGAVKIEDNKVAITDTGRLLLSRTKTSWFQSTVLSHLA